MAATSYFPNCCAVSIMSGFAFDYYGYDSSIPFVDTYQHSFVAIFHPQQRKAYLAVCKKHKLLSVTKVRGNDARHLAICVFQRGK